MRSRLFLSGLLLMVLAAAACSDDAATTATTPTVTVGSPAITQIPVTSQALTTIPDLGSCSAAGMPALGAQQGLPEAVAGLRDAIAESATECDLERFAELAREGPGEFIFSGGEILFFVGPLNEAADFLNELEADGIGVLADAVALLGLPFGFVEDPEPWGVLDDPALAPLYVWPAAAAHPSWSQVSDSEREAIRPLLGDSALQLFAEQDMYLGPQLGITDIGDWVFQRLGDL